MDREQIPSVLTLLPRILRENIWAEGSNGKRGREKEREKWREAGRERGRQRRHFIS